MTPRVKNKHKDKPEPGDVYIGRGSRWGNPFVIGRDGTREQVIQRFEALLKDLDLDPADYRMLRGRNLVCFCAPKPCHGDILLRIANDQAR